MQLTNRALLILLPTAPLLALATWLPWMQWIALVYFVAIVIVLIVDWRQALPIEQRFELERVHDTKLSLGANNSIQLQIRNRILRPATVWVRDEPPDEFRVDKRILSATIKGRQQWEGTYYVYPWRRGDYAFGNIHLRWLGPLGLMVRQGKVVGETAVKVYPNLLDVRRYDLLLKRNRLQELGLRSSRQFGEGTEFERLREYTPDDEYRRIDWKATARRHRPVTVQYQTERSQNVIAVLDTGRMMQSPVGSFAASDNEEQDAAHANAAVTPMAKLDYVINAVLLLSYVATGKGDKVGMMSFADDVGKWLSPKQGRGQFYRMLELLYGIEAQPVEPDYRRAFTYLAHKQRKRSLIIIFTDLSGGLGVDSLLSYISVLSRRSLPLVVTISDPDVVAAARQTPVDSLTVYQRSAAARLLDERQLALDHLHRQGVLTLDVPANQLSISVINRYLELKAKTLL